MEIDITRFCAENAPADYSASVAEIGDNAGTITWDAAKNEALRAPPLTTDEQLEALRVYVKGFGAWSDAEIAAWTPAECNALFIQLVSGDLREADLENPNDDDAWQEYERRANAGDCAGQLFRDAAGRVYYYLGG
jgi:hypothetical protein